MGRAKLKVVPDSSLKLDLGCGKNKKEGFTGVGRCVFPGVDVVTEHTELH